MRDLLRHPCRLLIADDDELVRSALSDVLRADARVEVLGVVGDGAEALDLVRQLVPDIALLDVMMPFGGIELVERVRAASPATDVVSMSAYANRRTRAALLAAGAVRFMEKGRLDALLLALEETCRARSH